MYGDYASTKRLVALGATKEKLEEFRLNNVHGYVIMGSGCAPGPESLDLTLFETECVIPWLLENQEDFTPMNLIGWR